MRDYQNSTLFRQSNDNETTLRHRMVWVGVSIRERITNTVVASSKEMSCLAKIACSFLLIPSKAHMRTITTLGSLYTQVQGEVLFSVMNFRDCYCRSALHHHPDQVPSLRAVAPSSDRECA